MKEEKHYCERKKRKYSNYWNFENQSNLQTVDRRDFQINDDRISTIEKKKVCLTLNIQNEKLFRFLLKQD